MCLFISLKKHTSGYLLKSTISANFIYLFIFFIHWINLKVVLVDNIIQYCWILFLNFYLIVVIFGGPTTTTVFFLNIFLTL